MNGGVFEARKETERHRGSEKKGEEGEVDFGVQKTRERDRDTEGERER